MANHVDSEEIHVSIIVPCFNAERYLPCCLDSLVSQTFSGIEIICINDGSTDGTSSILNEYQYKHPNIIKVINKKNEGAWVARRCGISLARGEYISFVDADDSAEPTFIEVLYQTAVSSKADLTVCGYRRVDSKTGHILSEEFTQKRPGFNPRKNPEMLLQINGAPWNKLFKASLLKHMHEFETPPAVFEDIMMHLLIYPEVRSISYAPVSLIRYNVHSNSIMTSIDESKIESTYNAILEVRDYYEAQGVPQSMLSFLDGAAFLHLGVSLMFRISYDKSASIRVILQENRAFLDKNFPTWKSSSCISLSNALRLGGSFRNLYLSRLIYKLHLMSPALCIYRFIIDVLGVEIKW